MEFLADVSDDAFEVFVSEEGTLGTAGVFGEDLDLVVDEDAFHLAEDFDGEGDGVAIVDARLLADGFWGDEGAGGHVAGSGGEGVRSGDGGFGHDAGDEAIDVDGVENDVAELEIEHGLAGFSFAAFVAGFGDEKDDFAVIFRAVFEHAGGVDNGVVHGGGGGSGVDFGEGLFEQGTVAREILHDSFAMVEGDDGGLAFFAEDEAFEEGADLLDLVEDRFDGVIGLDADDDIEGLESDLDGELLFFAAVDEAELVGLKVGDVATVFGDGGGGYDVSGERGEFREVAVGFGGGLVLPE